MLHYVSAYNLSQKICGIKLVAFQNSKTTKINATELHGNLHVHTVYTEGYVVNDPGSSIILLKISL